MLVRRLGDDDSERTWLSRDGATDEHVVIKLATTACARAALRREAARLVALAHPGIVRFKDCVDADRLTLLVTEFLPGGDLGVLRGKPWRDGVAALLPALAALAHLHAMGTVHGDPKPRNLVLGADGGARLVDLEDPDGCSARRGSPYGLSPARWCGAAAVPADDAYALGALLYELIGGAPPHYPDLAAAKRGVRPYPVGRPLPPALQDLIDRLLDRDPRLRPGAAAVAAEIRLVLAATAAPSDRIAVPRAWPAAAVLRFGGTP